MTARTFHTIERAINHADAEQMQTILDGIDGVQRYAWAIVAARQSAPLAKGFLRHVNAEFRRRGRRPSPTRKKLCMTRIGSARFRELGRFYFANRRDGVVETHVDIEIHPHTRDRWADWMRCHA